MERLTEKFKDGRNILRKGISDIFHVGFGRFFDGEAVDRLAEYEDLGLEPNEIKPYIELAEKMNVCDLVRENKRLADKIRFLEAQKRI